MPVTTPYPDSACESIGTPVPDPSQLSLFDLPPRVCWRIIVWRGVPIPAYEVSNAGEVRRRLPPKKRGKTEVGKVLSPSPNLQGYWLATLCFDGRSRTILTHHLVAEAFHGPRPLKAHINHKDGNKKNNCAWNLEYCTAKENSRHAWRTGLMKAHTNNRGEGHPLHKLTLANATEAKRLAVSGEMGLKQIAEMFGVSRDLIEGIKNGRNWAHLP